ncbi:MAG: universal stress protein [Crocinitomicaceae bacterium]|nr:universal stress protein [Crocinitomicaceae bacterium]
MKTILVATDFSPSSKNAISYSARLAMETGAKLILFHATHIPVVSDNFFDMGISLEELQTSDREEMEKVNVWLHQKFGSSLKLEKQVKIGFTVELIRAMVEKKQVDLVVMGISHTDTLSRVLFGSTSSSAAGNLNCPVLIIPEKVKYRPFSKLAFAFDQRHIPTGTGLHIVRNLVKLFEAKVHYVHVMDSPMKDKDDSSLRPVFKFFADKNPTIHYLQSIPGQTVAILNDWVRRYKASVLVMVSREHNIFWRIFNERTTKKMAFETRVPLLVIPETTRT